MNWIFSRSQMVWLGNEGWQDQRKSVKHHKRRPLPLPFGVNEPLNIKISLSSQVNLMYMKCILFCWRYQTPIKMCNAFYLSVPPMEINGSCPSLGLYKNFSHFSVHLETFCTILKMCLFIQMYHLQFQLKHIVMIFWILPLCTQIGQVNLSMEKPH